MSDQQLAAGCAGKHAFPSHRAAAEVARRQRRRDDGDPTAAYRCASCGHWHVGRPALDRPPGRGLAACGCRRCPCPRLARAPRRHCWRCRHGRHELVDSVPRETEGGTS